ncbi:MAG: phytochelatin synthase family protein [Gammaproteobacteria bacterium]|nr:phytochelatin synthase family protein [Gammaproteobacteria bacterium]MDH5660847.1 phytochelatin synthase family protein [Gammaproteobacteria bacterium]
MRNRHIANFILFIIFLAGSTAHSGEYGKFKPGIISFENEVDIVSWNSKQGQQRLLHSKYNNDYFQLAHHFQPQINPLYCGVASSVIVLNALRMKENSVPSQSLIEVDKPQALGGGRLTYPSYSQLTFLNDKTDVVKSRVLIEMKNVKSRKEELDPGLTLSQLKKILEIYDSTVEIFYADKEGDSAVDKFRDKLKTVLKEDKKFLLVNFYGKTIGTQAEGHISPVAAYESKTDSVLLLDVAGYLNPWYWVPVEHLYLAMHTMDGEMHRGYLVISE